MLTGYITFVDQSFSALRLYGLIHISCKLVHQEYKYQLRKPVCRQRMACNYPDKRLHISGNHTIH